MLNPDTEYRMALRGFDPACGMSGRTDTKEIECFRIGIERCRSYFHVLQENSK